MDKKSLTGLVIIGIILFGFTMYTSRQQTELVRQQAIADSIFKAQNPVPVTPLNNSTISEAIVANVDSASMLQNQLAAEASRQQHLGNYLYEASNGTETFYEIENDLVRMTVSNKGGRVAAVELKQYKTYKGTPLMLFDASSSVFDLAFFVKQGFNNLQINTGNYFFSTDAQPVTTLSETESEKSISMKLHVDSTSYVEYVYTLRKGNYMVDFDMNFVGMANVFANQSDMVITWDNVGPQNEKGFENENNYTTIAYMFPGEDKLEELAISKETKEETVNNKIKWIAFKQQFFSSIFIANDNFQNAELKYETFDPKADNIKKFSSKISIPFSPQMANYKSQFYFGPNKYSTLNKYDIGIQKLVPLGWGIFGWVNRWLVIPIFDFLGKYIANYGIIILLLTIIIKIIITPLTYKSYLSTAKMRLLKPELDVITAKYPKQDEAMKKQQAVMELYKKAGVSPMGGCIPMLIQFPILIAMFRFFPSSIELRGEHFLWADDLSSYDSILTLPFDIPFYGAHVSLFALLMAVSVYISSKINYAQTAATAPQMAGMKFMMLYMMPVMLLLWFNNYSSGLSYYYLVSNIITIGQTYAFRYGVDDQKLHRKMKENAKKPRKKSKWQERYEQMLKQQQQARK